MTAEAARHSLLDVVIDDYNLEKDLRTSRLLLVSQFASERVSADEILRWHSDFVKAYDPFRERERETKGERKEMGDGRGGGSGGSGVDGKEGIPPDPRAKITGLCFALSNSVMVHLIEAPTKTLMAYLRLLSIMVAPRKPDVMVPSTARGLSPASPPTSLSISPSVGASSLSMPGVSSLLSSFPASASSSSLSLPGAPSSTPASGSSGGGGTFSTSSAASSTSSSSLLIAPPSRPLLRAMRICSFTEEVPREFRVWACRAFGTKRDDDDAEATPPKDFLKLVFGVLRNFLEFARHMALWNEDKQMTLITDPQNLQPKQLMSRIPAASRIELMTLSEELCTPDEYLAIYDRPIDFTLESERVWPVEPFLKY